jgi:hypothetical protein
VSDPVEAPSRPWHAAPLWVRIGVLVLVGVIIATIAVVIVRVVTRTPTIPTGVTSMEDLRLGSCLAEDGRDLPEYTVVPCSDEHPQQVFATADLDLDQFVYDTVESSIAVFGDEVCTHFLEYRLFLREGLETNDYMAYAIAVPAPGAYRSGDTEALCAVAPLDGGTLTSDLYRPMP